MGIDIIILTFALKIAFVPFQNDYLYDIDSRYERCTTENYFYVDSSAKIDLFDLFFITGQINIPMLKTTDMYTFSPFNVGSRFSAGLHYSYFEIGFIHYCIHPVIPFHFMNFSIQYEGNHSEFYLQIQGNI
jgi:hypothetical protein